MNFEEITVEKIPKSIVAQIRKSLIDGELKPGQSLPSEVQLAKLFGVSRSSIRDAMQILESTGIINRRKRGGTTIRQITIEDMANIYHPKSEKENLFDLLETREILEIALVRLAAQRASGKDIEEIEKLITWMEEKPKEAAEADIAFHLALARVSQNEVMLNIIKSLKQIMNRLQEKTIYYPGRLEKIIIEHKQIVSAIKDKDEKLAQEYMKNHLSQIKELVKNI
ncbi:FadR/GntR family transcriptional regulator [Bacillus sp. CECT 9360]|uniref:FadR/GntR family transcriptional regulator n=1 Tax=Bacillus sp. CECT 9360 TaxID=2845821 RepID=UPI001E448D00|nr:FadR/GntR family transcriptional regulator [Bacillus sp. CECT 9360]CAH0346261.1 Putative L-lactate dehydrogenase operon regulatory protein [Bacillus sp. CECT 9360]